MVWLAKRIGLSLLLMWVVATIVFLALHMVPGDPAEMLLSTGGAMPDAYAIQELRERLGLNRPIHGNAGKGFLHHPRCGRKRQRR